MIEHEKYQAQFEDLQAQFRAHKPRITAVTAIKHYLKTDSKLDYVPVVAQLHEGRLAGNWSAGSDEPFNLPDGKPLKAIAGWQVVGVIGFPFERPEMYQSSRNRIEGRIYKHCLGDVFTIPNFGEFVCVAEHNLVYRLPPEATPKNDPDEGLRMISLPFYSIWFDVQDCNLVEEVIHY